MDSQEIALSISVLLLAILIDRLIGDPSTPLHPVALLGRFIGWWGKPHRYPPSLQRLIGALLWIVTVALFTLPAVLISLSPAALFLIFGSLFLKFCFAWRSLEEHTLSVVEGVGMGLERGRERVKLMVSRRTETLEREEILSAAYESLTENLTDSITAPLFAYSLAGLPGAALYRAANTLDAMLGYKDERLRLGNVSARMDDLLTYIPARVTVVLLLFWFALKGRFWQAWTAQRKDAKKRPGFNGGIVMATMAGGCGVQFVKNGVYTMGIADRSLDEAGPDILTAVRVVSILSIIIAAGFTLLLTLI